MSIIKQGFASADLDVPVVLPTLNLDFANSQSLDKRITFTRGSIGTRVNRNGLIETVSANQPRFDFDPISGECRGLLIEEQRINYTTYSTYNTTGSAWFMVTSQQLGLRIETGLLAPDGSNTAARFVSAGTNYAYARINFSNLPTTPTGIQYTFSFYAKLNKIPISTSAYNVDIGDEGGFNYYSQLKLGEWVRISRTVNKTDSSTYKNFADFINGGTVEWDLTVWGAQVEQGAFPTSYIPTTASTVTRSADNADMTGTNFSSWYNSSEGTLFVSARINALGGPGYPGIAYVDDGTVNNCMGFYVDDAGTDRIGAESYISGRLQYGFASSSATTANKLNKAISSYSINNFSGAFDTSGQVQRDTNGSIPTVDRLRIGALRGDVYKLNGTISRLTYYPKALSPAQLQYLTQ